MISGSLNENEDTPWTCECPYQAFICLSVCQCVCLSVGPSDRSLPDLLPVCLILCAHPRISKNNQELDERNAVLKRKLQGAKARIAILEKENSKARKSIKLVMEKSANDDRLIEGIRAVSA
jgi:hypothetical protein